VASSNFSSLGKFSIKSQAAFSASVLLFSYAYAIFGSVQSFSVKWVYPSTPVLKIDAIDDVTTTLLTLFNLAAFITARVPSTAGLISTFSSFGFSIGNGEAVWTI
jgi:hypothetical protein